MMESTSVIFINGQTHTMSSVAAQEILALRQQIAAAREAQERDKRDAERYRWLESVAQPAYIAPASEIDTRMEWKLPTLIALTCINSEVSFSEAIDLAQYNAIIADLDAWKEGRKP